MEGIIVSKKKLAIGILSVSIVCALAIGGTLAFLTDSEKVTNTFSIGDLDISIDEPHWNNGTPDDPATTDTDESTPGDGDDMTPGDTKVKDPTVTANVNDSYMRVIMTVIDNEPSIANPDYVDAATTPDLEIYIPNPNYGKVITDKNRLDLILKTIYYDATYNVSSEPATTGLTPGEKYSLEELSDFTTVNPDFTEDTSKSTAGTYYYNYKKIFNQDEKAVLFTNIVIPTDWNATHLNTMGKYKIEVYAQAIQSDNFEDADKAFSALDAEVEAGTVQYNYATVGGKSDK